jgi:hypothetical protein
VTTCEDKVAYLSEYLAHNAAVLHTFLHPECTDVREYPCPASVRGGGDRHWHIGHKHRDRGESCKATALPRPPTTFKTTKKPRPPRRSRGAA